MKHFVTAAAVLVLLAAPVGSALAQPGHDDHHDNHDNHKADNHRPDNHPGPGMAMHGPAMAMHGPVHHDWHNGGKIEHADWNRGARVDWHAHHLRTPPRGYEWREVDGNYVLAAVATGLIASVLLAQH